MAHTIVDTQILFFVFQNYLYTSHSISLLFLSILKKYVNTIVPDKVKQIPYYNHLFSKTL